MVGTIPASTGEPSLLFRFARPSEDYPREHGGTHSYEWAIISEWGLSPRARGNPLLVDSLRMSMRTIPASTGEPCIINVPVTICGDYPREHGGTCRNIL